MPDRSPEEREAARVARELRRAEREGRSPRNLASIPQPPPEPRAAPEPESQPEPEGQPEPPAPASPGPLVPHAGSNHHDPGFDTGSHHPGFDTGSHDLGFDTGSHDPGFDTESHDPAADTGSHEPPFVEPPDAGANAEIPSGTRRISHAEGLSGRQPPPRRPTRRRVPGTGEGGRHSWLGRAMSLLALAVAAVLIWFLVELFQPFIGSPHGRITVIVPAHSTSSDVGDLLARDGVISSSFFFELRATLAGDRSSLRAGAYHLQLGMSYGAVLTALTKVPPAAKVSELTITEGRTRQYIAGRLKAEHLGHGNYLAQTRHTTLINWRAYGRRKPPLTLEGFLFPDTYQLIDPVDVSTLVRDQLVAFKQNFAKVNLNYAKRKRLTAYDVVTIASMIEAEAATERDRPLIASVIYNRLADGMMLQFDSTTRYATGNYTRPLTVSQLHSSSPWNTHTHFGLPPTPIDSPGLAALQAAAHPARTNYLFFFARRCGRPTAYASNYSQFLNLANQDAHQKCR